MSRCEDAPCCGCGPEGCIDRSRTVSCEDCGRTYYPDPQTERFCYRCQLTLEREDGDYGDEE